MAKVYLPPEEMGEISGLCDETKIEKFKSDLREFCKENSNCKDAGEIIDFPIADGKALYMVFDYRTLIHLPIYDAYAIPDAHARGLRKADIVANIKMKKEWAKIIDKK